jgi:glycosidase
MRRVGALACILVASLASAAPPPPTAADRTMPDDLATYRPAPYVRVRTPEWARHAVLYELNVRQFTAEGTFAAAEAQLPRLAALGVDIVWLMPIHPIGQKNRKGPLGSPYAVKDYVAVNPEFGTLADFKRFVARAHELGLRVILDWVANHTAWDNALASQHPDWYSRDWRGQFHPTSWNDWSDIIELDYDQPGLRRYMTEALTFWVRETGVDGYRCDVAGYVPLDFWNGVRRELEAIKPVFLLAEWQATDLHQDAFDATYAWDWYEAAVAATTGGQGVGALRGYYSTHENAWPREAMRLTFVTNHDKNSWDGTEFEQFGPGLEAATVLSVVGTGLPLIYNGQEAGNDKQLAFFDRDPIAWRDGHPRGDLYRRLFALKKAQSVLWNGRWGAPMIDVPNSVPADVLSFVRMDERGKVFAVFNFSPRPQVVSFTEGPQADTYRDFATGSAARMERRTTMSLPPWGYRVLVR